jgi:cellulose biosynthesis protein BcsQ
MAADFLKDVKQKGTQYDKILVDTPGSINIEGLTTILFLSDFIILPTRPSDDDFIPTKKFINFIFGTVYKDEDKDPNLIGIFNQTSLNSLVLKSRLKEVNTDDFKEYIHFLDQVIPSAEAKASGNILAEDENVKFSGINTFLFPEYLSGRSKVNIFQNLCIELEEIFKTKL